MAISRFLQALHDEGHDPHFLGGKAVANASADQIVFDGAGLHDLGRLPNLSGSDPANAVRQRWPSHIAENNAAKALLQILSGALIVFGDDDSAAARGFKQHNEPREVRRIEEANSTMELGKVVMAWNMRSRSVHCAIMRRSSSIAKTSRYRLEISLANRPG